MVPDPTVIYTSTAQRARESALLVAGHFGIAVTLEPRIAEVATTRDGTAVPPRCRLSPADCSDGDELWCDVIQRVHDFISYLVPTGASSVVAVTHSGVIDAFFEIVTGSDHVELESDYASVTTWRRSRLQVHGWQLVAHNRFGAGAT
ncbi:hypothetical protein APU90_09590 [Rathayibacter toxicus]|nr:hypothetical protein APU90_09590 [Rathayibacter toxicus]